VRFFVGLSLFHHEDDALQDTNVVERVALDGDQIGPLVEGLK
jgi:hypothetical protein